LQFRSAAAEPVSMASVRLTGGDPSWSAKVGGAGEVGSGPRPEVLPWAAVPTPVGHPPE
jgi:hypothetical protein